MSRKAAKSGFCRLLGGERSVVDDMRLRKGQVGVDVAYEALRRYLKRPEASLGGLPRSARRLGADVPMSDALEVLTN